MRLKIISLICFFIYISLTPNRLLAANEYQFPVTPTLNNGAKWRIGYYQGGDYGSYQKSLAALVKSLMQLGWIKAAPLPPLPNETDTASLWQWLGGHLVSDYLEFPANAYYDAKWQKDDRKVLQEEIVTRLNTIHDIDLMLAMGTWAGQDLASSNHSTPTMVCSTTDPIASGIIKSAEDSGLDHVLAKVDPDRHKRQVRLFYKIFNFKNLGIVYEESPEGRGFSAVDAVFETANQLGFKVQKCEAQFNGTSLAETEQNINTCYRQLADQVDAVYIVRHPGVNLKNLPNILEPLISKKIPTFAQGLSEEVAHGVLLSISLADFSYIGDYYAATIAQIFNGAKPRQLTQVFQNPPKIAINLKTAQLIGYDPSVDIVGAADEIYTEIEPPPLSE